MYGSSMGVSVQLAQKHNSIHCPYYEVNNGILFYRKLLVLKLVPVNMCNFIAIFTYQVHRLQ